ncbi:MAG: hypothetical protein ACI4TB_02675, partial [Lachnospiraceae bacterium]
MKGKKKYEKMSVREACLNYLRTLLRIVAEGYLVLMALVLPFYFRTATDYSYIGSNKSDFFKKYGFAAAKLFLTILLFYFLLALVDFCKRGQLKALWNRFSLTDRFAAVYAIGLCLSYCFSEYKEEALVGAEGWYMGLWPQLLLVGSYFAVSRLLSEKAGKWMTQAMLAVAAVAFLLGFLNRYGINPLGMEDSGPYYISTIGNINWYCGYWSVLFPLGAGLFLLYEKPQKESDRVFLGKRVALGIFVAVGFATGITQGSDSGILALAAMVLLMGWLCVREPRRIKRFLEMLLIFCGMAMGLFLIQWISPEMNTFPTAVYGWITETPLSWIGGACVLLLYLLFRRKEWGSACNRTFRILLMAVSVGICMTILSFLIMLIMNTVNPGSIGGLSDHPLFTFGAEWGSRRGATWRAGIRIWQEQDFLHKLVGVGPDCMSAYLYSGAGTAIAEELQELFGTYRLTNAHGEWITILVNLGLLGLVGFAGMMV